MTLRNRISLATALLAAGALLAGTVPDREPAPVAAGDERLTAAQAWPSASRADLPDLGIEPLLFLDATTAVGTVSDRDALRLVIVADGRQRELRRLPAGGDARFDTVTASGEDLLWTESTGDRPTEIWTARAHADESPRMITADTGNVLFYGTQYDLVVADGRVHWTAGEGSGSTQIRSVALTGGAVQVRTEAGQWALTAWPWLTDDAAGGQTGAITMRNLETGSRVAVPVAASEWSMCSPSWCRVMVMDSSGPVRIDAMRPDGSDRRRVAGPQAQAAVTDVAVLDRFEILSEPGPNADLTGVAGLIVHDLDTGRTVALSAAADLAATRDGMLWWSTGDQETAIWHTLDLRTA
ncbi:MULTISPECIES: hypothetical protein [Actinoplanes]|uniref:hypothetical protein n=1 Tax=Actinoplanes TaxID=1865 RepID=UPI0005F2F372|nr:MULTISPECIES: hypothetical protein [Actinoplanes]GLY02603.1 hypothetical protein Acsp01_29820 [Actinoplanes sp. NBRC 101535]